MVDSFDLLSAALSASDSVARMSFAPIDKALDPLDPHDFLTITRRLGARLTGVAGPLQARALDAALDKLDVDWPSMSAAQVDKVLVAANRAIGSYVPKVARAVDLELERDARGFVTDVKRKVIDKYNLKISTSFTTADERVAKFAGSSQGNYVTDNLRRRVDAASDKAREIVSHGVELGLGRDEITTRLVERMGTVVRPPFYWEVIASSYAGRARTFSHVFSFHEAGIEFYKWESVLDERTTEVCRFMHGKRFPVGNALQQFEKLEKTQDPEEIKVMTPWVRDGKDDRGAFMYYNGAKGQRVEVARVDRAGFGKKDEIGSYSKAMGDKQLLGNGISLPPLHGLCRSTVLGDVETISTQVPEQVAAPKPRKPRKPRKPKQTTPKLDQWFGKTFVSKDFAKEDLDDLSTAVDDAGLSDWMKTHKVDNFAVTTKTSKRPTITSPSINESHNGVYYQPMLPLDYDYPRAKPEYRMSSLKILGRERPKRTSTDPIPWSTSSLGKDGRDARKRTLVHELGHHVHLHDRFVKLRSGKDLSTSEFRKVDGVIREAYKKLIQNRVMPKQLVTRYSATNAEEYFAESFALHTYDPELLKTKDPVGYDMVVQVRKMRGIDK